MSIEPKKGKSLELGWPLHDTSKPTPLGNEGWACTHIDSNMIPNRCWRTYNSPVTWCELTHLWCTICRKVFRNSLAQHSYNTEELGLWLELTNSGPLKLHRCHSLVAPEIVFHSKTLQQMPKALFWIVVYEESAINYPAVLKNQNWLTWLHSFHFRKIPKLAPSSKPLSRQLS